MKRFEELELLRGAVAAVEKFFPECPFLSEEEKARVLRIPIDMAAGDADNLEEDRSRHMRLEVEISWLDATLTYLVEEANQQAEKLRGDIIVRNTQGRDKAPAEHILKGVIAADTDYAAWREEAAKRERLRKFVSGLAFAMGRRNDILKDLSREQNARVGQ